MNTTSTIISDTTRAAMVARLRGSMPFLDSRVIDAMRQVPTGSFPAPASKRPTPTGPSSPRRRWGVVRR